MGGNPKNPFPPEDEDLTEAQIPERNTSTLDEKQSKVEAERCQRLFKMYQKAVKPGPQCPVLLWALLFLGFWDFGAQEDHEPGGTPAMTSPLRPRLPRSFRSGAASFEVAARQ